MPADFVKLKQQTERFTPTSGEVRTNSVSPFIRFHDHEKPSGILSAAANNQLPLGEPHTRMLG